MDCQLVRVNERLVICAECGRGLPLPASTVLSKIRRACQSIKPEIEYKVVFTDTTDLGYRPWTLYTFTHTQLSQCKVKPTVLDDDGLRVGTRFQANLPKVTESSKCDCENLRRLLDAAPLNFIRQYEDQLSRRIKRSARSLGWIVPWRLVRVKLRKAIKAELREYGRQ